VTTGDLPEFAFDPYLIANVFKSGFNFHAPQFDDIDVYPHMADNFAKTLDSFTLRKYYSPGQTRLTDKKLSSKRDSIAVTEKFMVNEVKFSAKLNENFKRGLDHGFTAQQFLKDVLYRDYHYNQRQFAIYVLNCD
jgi:hypothetical protein